MKILELNKNKKNHVSKEEMEQRIKKLEKERSRLVKGVFEFTDAQGGWLSFTNRFLPSDPLRTITIYHGETIELPIGIIRDLQGTKKKIRKLNPEHLKDPNANGPFVFEIQSRINFTPLEYAV